MAELYLLEKGDVVEKKINRRLLYRTLLKLLIAVGLSFVIYAFVADYIDKEGAGQRKETIIVDVQRLAPNQDMRIRWDGRGLIVIHRNHEIIRQLRENPGRLTDPYSKRSQQPEFAEHPLRSLEDEYFIAWLPRSEPGCTFMLIPAGLAQQGQIVDSCTQQAWDFAGRALADTGDAANLEVPEHRWMTPSEIVIFR